MQLAQNYRNPFWLTLAAFVVLKLALHFCTNTNYELHRDTYLYLALADHLDFGFVSVPPGIAVLAKLSNVLFGESDFAVGIFPALIGAASLLVIGLLVKEFEGGIWALVLACSAFVISPAFLRSNTFLQPVSFDQFFWLWSAYFIVKLLKSQNPIYWLHLSVVSGLAFLTKYAIAFLALAFLIALALSPQRRLFASKFFGLGAFMGLVLILPNLIWQGQHNWPVVQHMRELQETQLVNVALADFVLLQFLMNLPAVFVWIFGLIFLLSRREQNPYRALGFTFLLVLALLLALRGKAYYTLGIYTTLFAAGGAALEKYFTARRTLLKPLALAVMLAIALPVMPYSVPLLPMDKMLAYAEASKDFGLSGALQWEDGRIHSLPQDYADMIGWKELTAIVSKTYHGLSAAEQERCVIYAENYGQAGAIRYYGKQIGLPEPVSFHESFVFWAPAKIEHDDLILIYVNDELGEDLAQLFGEITLAGQLDNVYAREHGVQVYLCKNPQAGFAEFYNAKVAMLKNRFRSAMSWASCAAKAQPLTGTN